MSTPETLPPFTPTVPDALRAAFAKAPRLSAAPGETIIMAGDNDRDVYWVESGTIRFTLHSESGRETIFGEASADTLFGELAAIDGRARSVIAVALDPTVLRRISAAEFVRTVTHDPALAHWSMRLLTWRLRDMTQRSFEMSALTVQNRIAAALWRMSAPAAKEGGASVIDDFPTHEVFAAMIGTHREAVTRGLRQLASSGILTQTGRTMVLHDRARLEPTEGI